ncbi:hypothetical protein N0V83_007075 [Neocucurbitaria cava]|uniref:proline--tRNA ligase n=1 Tax=Neocucurbitaria cava TaxID=798079 RepID=A0A9W8Y6X7_9PLEO|nr:hypothetical protein N0V83_007075 [Neocucurbitaria cava]
MESKAHSGVFHLLPLGLRVQNKLETLIDKYMQSIGASKLSLSAITTEALWRESGRYSKNSELLRINDRRESGFLLSPTHEEEITALVASLVHSYKDLPVRLYQVGRKYRDERRPRQGLLRAKEFMMKDLYTFDHSPQNALKTYEAVRQAYNNIFDELKLPYLVADADSGNMGGKLSHEYHFVSPKGEDNVWSCDSCEYVANEELVEKKTASPKKVQSPQHTARYTFRGISVDRKTEIQVHLPNPSSAFEKDEHLPWSRISEFANLHAIKNALPDDIELDTGMEASTLAWCLSDSDKVHRPIIHLFDRALHPSHSSPDLTITRPGDACPRCSTGTLSVQKAIEVGHTFHLGTRYSTPLNALVAVPENPTKEPMQMGCHGIGVSRIIGAVASLLADEKGLNWPRVIAPYEAVILTSPQTGEEEAVQVYDALCSGTRSDGGQGAVDGKGEVVDLVLDDRPIKSLGWKLRDADLIGYPVVVVLGRAWKERREVEVQCRRLGVKQDVGLGELKSVVLGMLEQL